MRRPPPGAPSFASLRVDDRSNEELAALSEYLRRLSTWVAEYRYLRMEREREVLERIGNRPTLGYYLQLRRQKPVLPPGEHFPPLPPAAARTEPVPDASPSESGSPMQRPRYSSPRRAI